MMFLVNLKTETYLSIVQKRLRYDSCRSFFSKVRLIDGIVVLSVVFVIAM